MREDKALIQFRGRPLVAHALGILRDAGLPASISGSRSHLTSFALVIDDLDSGLGPLSGICSALAVSHVTWLVFVPVDLPFLPPGLVRALLDHAQRTLRPITLASVAGFTQTFPCVLNRTTRPLLRTALESGSGGCFAAFRAAAEALGEPLSVIPAELLAQTGQVRHPEALPPAEWFFNINSPADLARAEALRPGLAAHTDRIA